MMYHCTQYTIVERISLIIYFFVIPTEMILRPQRQRLSDDMFEKLLILKTM